MSFESVWGFDPDRAIRAEALAHGDLEPEGSTYSAAEQRAARIPSDVDSQIYALRRMYRQ